MKLSARAVLVVTCVIYVSVSLPCPENCRSILGYSKCDPDTGACSDGCGPGYYGVICNKPCDQKCLRKRCHRRDGTCTCVPGYNYKAGSCVINKGVKCKSNQHCTSNKCISAGREECLHRCKAGWFGSFCAQRCREHCLCELESGNCTSCEAGWSGDVCQHQCSSGCIENTCHRNGSCIEGCQSGSHGVQCELKCPPHCVSGCDRLSGECVQCEAGRYGSTCQFQCSARCVGCHRDGTCQGGCTSGFYGEKCEFRCPQHCDEGLCYIDGTCRACKIGLYGYSCNQPCEKCTDGICIQKTGACTRGCVSGYYGGYCNFTCDSCTDDDCDGSCTREDDDCESCTHEDGTVVQTVQYWVGGSVAVVLIIFVAAVLVYICFRLKRVDGAMYDMGKWRRRPASVEEDHRGAAAPSPHVVVPDYCEVQDEVDIRLPRGCPMGTLRQTSYLDPQHSDGTGTNIAQPQQQQQAAGLSEQGMDGEPQAASASPGNLPPSDKLLPNVLRRSDDWSDRPDSYVLPHYCEVNEEMMAAFPQPVQGAEAPAPVSTNSSLSGPAGVYVPNADEGNATGGDINIPLIAECFGNTETEDSSPDEEPRPEHENYDHPFRDHYH